MGLLDGLIKTGLSKVLGGQGAQAQNGIQGQIVEAVLQQVLGNKSQGGAGGLGGLVDMLKSNGLSDAVDSWTGQGANQAVSSQQLEQGLDANILGSIADQIGISKSQTASELSNVLPGLIDKLTPEGQVNNELGLDDALNVLGKLLK